MKIVGLMVWLAVGMAGHVLSYSSGIAIAAEDKASLRVFINGKSYTKKPVQFVRIKSSEGLFHVQVNVLNPYDKRWYIVKKSVRVSRGYEYSYKIAFDRNKKPFLKADRCYPAFSNYFINPSLFTRAPVS